MASRVYNFGAGPAMLPEEVLRQAQQEFLNWQGTGMSIVEISHRSSDFADLLIQTEQDLRQLLIIPENYRVLFLSAPARAQFAMIPMNLLRGKKSADYLETGVWSKMAIDEAQRYTRVNIAASAAAMQYRSIPDRGQWDLNPDAAYVYYTHNETINGLLFATIPQVGEIPLVCDMTSSLLTQPLDISRYGLVFAGAQKNIAPAGLTIVIVRHDLLGEELAITPSVFNYQLQDTYQSLYYTPNTFSIYMASLMFKWLKGQGGVPEMWQRNRQKSQTLYNYIDNSDFYFNLVAGQYRSHCNVPFQLRDEKLVTTFLDEAKSTNLVALKGHRLVGGLRASLYNAMPQAGVESLIGFMQDFARRYA